MQPFKGHHHYYYHCYHDPRERIVSSYYPHHLLLLLLGSRWYHVLQSLQCLLDLGWLGLDHENAGAQGSIPLLSRILACEIDAHLIGCEPHIGVERGVEDNLIIMIRSSTEVLV